MNLRKTLEKYGKEGVEFMQLKQKTYINPLTQKKKEMKRREIVDKKKRG